MSFGKGCARKEYPGVYAKVASFMGWIIEEVEKAKRYARWMHGAIAVRAKNKLNGKASLHGMGNGY